MSDGDGPHGDGPVGESPWCSRTGTGAALDIWTQPGASRSEVAGMHDQRLRIRIAAPPAEGRANTELVRFLAELLAVPKSAVTIRRGTGSRRKTITIEAVDVSHILQCVEDRAK